MERALLGISLLLNFLCFAALIIDAQIIENLHTDLRITKRKLDRYRRREVSLGYDTEN